MPSLRERLDEALKRKSWEHSEGYEVIETSDAVELALPVFAAWLRELAAACREERDEAKAAEDAKGRAIFGTAAAAYEHAADELAPKGDGDG